MSALWRDSKSPGLLSAPRTPSKITQTTNGEGESRPKDNVIMLWGMSGCLLPPTSLVQQTTNQ